MLPEASIVIQADARYIPFVDGTFQCCVTSPPYWGLRDYGLGPDALGLEPTPELYVQHIVEIMQEVWRVLRDDGTLWLNLGDSYAGSNKGYISKGKWSDRSGVMQSTNIGSLELPPTKARSIGLKPKDLVGIPWRVAFALQADGWWLRSDIIWHKTNPMPESVKDRPTKSHEYLFLLTKSKRYFYDTDAVREISSGSTGGGFGPSNPTGTMRRDVGRKRTPDTGIRNRRTVWPLPTKPYKGAHFATYPPALVEPCILAGSAVGDIILDPFCGSGTTGIVAIQHGRGFVGLDLSMSYLCDLATHRLSTAQPEEPIQLVSPEQTRRVLKWRG